MFGVLAMLCCAEIYARADKPTLMLRLGGPLILDLLVLVAEKGPYDRLEMCDVVPFNK